MNRSPYLGGLYDVAVPLIWIFAGAFVIVGAAWMIKNSSANTRTIEIAILRTDSLTNRTTPMNYVKIEPKEFALKDLFAANKNQPVTVEGIYLGSKQVRTSNGSSMLYRFRGLKKGEAFLIWGFTRLDQLMEYVATGVPTKIIYSGMKEEETSRGKVDVHQCEVFQAISETPESKSDDLPF